MKINSIIVSSVLCLSAPALAPTAQAQTSQSQNATVRGTVVDENGEPVIGATVLVKGKPGLGTATDLEGKFTIKTQGAKQLEISYVGYTTATVNISGKYDVKVELKPSAELLEDLVVVGYGTQKKESLTGAISQIKGDQVYRDRGVTNTAVALQGEIAGLTVTRGSTRPGSENAKFQIRGANSINGDSSPLILIDGQAASLDELNSMDGSVIENISVLKDASAAIYGARSAGGVILVTTKRGKAGKARVSYSGSYSRTIDGIQLPITNNNEWLDMFYEAQYRDTEATNPGITDPNEIHNRINWWIFNSFGGTPVKKNETTGEWETYGEQVVGEGLFNKLKEGNSFFLKRGEFIDSWQPGNYLLDFLYGNADTWKHNVAVSGGDDKFNYFASLNYSDAQSQLKIAEDGEKKYGARLNMDYKPTDFFKIETGMAYDKRDITTPSQGIGRGWQDMWFWAITNENGDAYDTFSNNRNPYGWFTQAGETKAKWSTLRANGKITLDFSKWVKGLSINGTAAYKSVRQDVSSENLEVRFYDWVGNQTSATQNSPAKLEQENKEWTSYTLGLFAQYNRLFAEKHQVDAMFGITGENEDYKRVKAGRYKGELYPGSGLSDLNVFQGGDNNAAEGGSNSWSFLSYVGDFRYAFNDTYLLSFLYRHDGSSKLTPENRWKDFYSISGGWVFTNENFFRNLNIDQWMNFGKIRYNFGKTGSVNGIGNYEAYSTIKTGSIYLGGRNLTTMWIDGMRSANRTWETLYSHDIGIDLGFFSNRLRASFDWFSKKNDGMFIDVVYPSILGASAPKTNNGKLTTRGWEVELNWRDQIGKVQYNVGLQISDAWTKVNELTNNENIPFAGHNKNRLIGKPLDAIYVFQTDGIFQNQEEVDAYYEMYYWNADHSGPKSGNILPAPSETGTNRLRPGARKRVDIDGDGVITDKDIYYAGDAAPRLSFGIKGGLNWNGIDFSFFFQGVGKQTVLRDGNMYAPFVVNYCLQNNTFLGKTWTPGSGNNDYTVMSRDNNFNRFNYQNSDVSVQNNRYVRLKNLVVGYTLPHTITSKVGVEKFRVYFSGDDLWEWSKIKDGYDPEYGEGSNNIFPLCRMLNFGVELEF